MEVMDIVALVAMLLLGGLSLYLKTKSKLTAQVTGLIDAAEEAYRDTMKAGGAKFNWVVDKLIQLVPVPLQMIFTRELIGRIVQSTFNTVEHYARLQLDKAADRFASKR